MPKMSMTKKDISNCDDLHMLAELVKPLDELVYRRCYYIVDEIQRLQAACEDLGNSDLQALGKKMYRTHKDLSEDYEVSCKELDFLVNAVKDNANVLGARMMGGGFWGCTINIIKQEAVNRLTEEVGKAYKKSMGTDMDSIIVQTSGCTEIITKKLVNPFSIKEHTPYNVLTGDWIFFFCTEDKAVMAGRS